MLRRLGVSARWSNAFNVLVLFFGMIGGAQIFLWLDRDPPIDVDFRVIQTISVRPSGEFRYLEFGIRHSYCETQMVERWFVDSEKTIRDVEPSPEVMFPGALNTRQMSPAKVKVPRGMPPGVSESCFRPRFECNPVQKLWRLYGPETCLTFLVNAVAPISTGPQGPQGPVGPAGATGPVGPPGPQGPAQ